MGWEVQALIGSPDDGWKVIGSVHVDVVAEATTSVVIQSLDGDGCTSQPRLTPRGGLA
jgi:hypothetical protein